MKLVVVIKFEGEEEEMKKRKIITTMRFLIDTSVRNRK